MKLFKKLVLASTIGTYLVIFVGGLVRVSGAGLGCPDWPRCFGRWFPPTSIDQIPDYIDASQFNLTLAWIEYINRLGGFLLGLLIAATAVVALIYHRKNKKILVPSVVSAFLVALLGAQGAVVISSELEPIVVTVHLLLALAMASLLIYTTYQAFSFDKERLSIEIPKNVKMVAHIFMTVTLLQILLGTHIRSKLEMLSREFPLLTDLKWLGRVGMVNHIHMLIGVSLGVFTLYFVNELKHIGATKIPGVKYGIWGLQLFILVQIFIGFTFTLFALPELGRVFHMFFASLFFGALVLTYSSLKSNGR